MASEKEIFPSGWAKEWLERTYPNLRFETLTMCYVVSIISLLISGKAFLNLRKCRKELDGEPSDRAATFAEHEKRMRKVNCRQFYLSTVYLVHILLIWLVDAGIGVFYIYQDTTTNPDDYTPAVWLDLAVHMVSMLAIFLAVFVLFPFAQILLVGNLVERFNRTNRPAGETYAAYIPEARSLTNHLAFLWSAMGFFVMAWWEPFSNPTVRLVILEGIMGSCIAWYHASFILNFRAESLAFLADLEIQPLTSITDGVKMYGTQVYTVHAGKGADVLPKYEPVAQSEQQVDEKSVL